MNSENTSSARCAECNTLSVLDHLAEALDKLGVDYTIEQHAA